MPLRTLPVAGELLGLVAAAQPEALMVWEERDGRRTLTDRQETDEQSGDPVWTAYLLPTVAERPEVLQVRVPAKQQPVLGQFAAVAVDNLEVSVRVGKSGQLQQYWSAASIRDAGHQGHRPQPKQEHKGEGQ